MILNDFDARFFELMLFLFFPHLSVTVPEAAVFRLLYHRSVAVWECNDCVVHACLCAVSFWYFHHNLIYLQNLSVQSKTLLSPWYQCSACCYYRQHMTDKINSITLKMGKISVLQLKNHHTSQTNSGKFVCVVRRHVVV